MWIFVLCMLTKYCGVSDDFKTVLIFPLLNCLRSTFNCHPMADKGALSPLWGFWGKDRSCHCFCTHTVKTTTNFPAFWCIIYMCRVKIVKMGAGWRQKFQLSNFFSHTLAADVTHSSSEHSVPLTPMLNLNFGRILNDFKTVIPSKPWH